jgi:pyridoxal phosphate enzyme (YggS family)
VAAVAGPDGTAPPPDPIEVAALAAARARVLEGIAAACDGAGRDPSSVTLVAVSKTVPAERLRAAVAAGSTILGENRVQEAEGKIPLVPGAAWHLVGPLQSNKVRRAIRLFSMVQTVDGLDLATRLDRIVREERGLPESGSIETSGRLPVLLQVNVDRDPGKAGFEPESVGQALPVLLALGALRVAGLMTIGQLGGAPEAARPTFRRLRELSERLRSEHPALGAELSMGMTDDYPVAVEEGATIVRVGRALFGERPGI